MSDRTPLPPNEVPEDDPRIASLVALQQVPAPERAESRDTLVAIAMAVYDHEVVPLVSTRQSASVPSKPVHTVRTQPVRSSVTPFPVPPVYAAPDHEPSAVISLDAARARRMRRYRLLTAAAAVAAIAVVTPLALRRNGTGSSDPLAGGTGVVTSVAAPGSESTPVGTDPGAPPPTATFDSTPKAAVPSELEDHGIMALNAIPSVLRTEMKSGTPKALPVLPACAAEAEKILGGAPTHAFLAETGSSTSKVIVVGRSDGTAIRLAALDAADCHDLMVEATKSAK